MKTLITVLISVVITVTAFAQQQKEVVSIDVNQLPPELKEKVIQQQSIQKTKEKMQEYGQWVGLGQELGAAIDGGLTAVEKHADKIADTNIGKVTIALIVFKVVGMQLVQYIAAFAFFLVWVPTFIYSFRKNCSGTSENPYSGNGDVLWSHFVVAVALVGITCLIAFAH